LNEHIPGKYAFVNKFKFHQIAHSWHFIQPLLVICYQIIFFASK
jgi:hypothetical protein